MGILILLEGQYFKGDWISVSGVEGEVEEVGLRRTVVRDASGTVHSISNREVRISSNLTRGHAVIRVEVLVPRGADVDRAIDVVDRVGREMAADPEWADRLVEPPHYTSVASITESGATLRVSGRVQPADRWKAAGELRRRIVGALTSEGIDTPR
jgi:small conductance mechanosensitive channel